MNLPFDRLPFPQLVKHWANDDAQKWPIEETAKMLAEAILAGEISVDPSAEEVDVVANLSGNGVVQNRKFRPLCGVISRSLQMAQLWRNFLHFGFSSFSEIHSGRGLKGVVCPCRNSGFQAWK
jgi:hypothetical protein